MLTEVMLMVEVLWDSRHVDWLTVTYFFNTLDRSKLLNLLDPELFS